MNPCPQYREALTLLAARALDAVGASSARSHLETCAGCRGYFQEIQRVCGVLEDSAEAAKPLELPGRFHQRLAARVREDARVNIQVTWSKRLAEWFALRPVSLAAGLAALVVFAVVIGRNLQTSRDERFITRGPIEQAAVNTHSDGASSVRASLTVPAPTLIAMRQAWNESPESLDGLLARQEQLLAANDPATSALGLTIEF